MTAPPAPRDASRGKACGRPDDGRRTYDMMADTRLTGLVKVSNAVI